ncbi:MAG TPA: hypothetical protein VIL37_07380 [Natronosporangium sp.]
MVGSVDSPVITVASPDSNLAVELTRRGGFALRFRPGSYPQYDEATLAHQLAQLGRLARVAYLREYQREVERTGRVINDWDPNRRRYRQALRELAAAGASPSGNVQVTSTGLMEWWFEIQPGTLASFTEPQFVVEVEGAVANVIADHEARAVLLKDEFFGLDLPPSVREAIARR